MRISSNYFYGHKVSQYGEENKRVDYGTLAKAFNHVLNNDIMSATDRANLGYWDQLSGFVDNSEEIQQAQQKIEELEKLIDEQHERITEDSKPTEDVQTHINIRRFEHQIDELNDLIEELENEQYNQDEIFQYYVVDDSGAELLQEINEIVFYNEEIDVYLWGVTHWGTSWDYVLTDIEIDPNMYNEEH